MDPSRSLHAMNSEVNHKNFGVTRVDAEIVGMDLSRTGGHFWFEWFEHDTGTLVPLDSDRDGCKCMFVFPLRGGERAPCIHTA